MRTSSRMITVLRGDSGQAMIEYAMLAFFVAIAAFVLMSTIGVDVSEFYDSVENVTGDASNGNEPVTVPADDNANEAT